MGKVCKDCRWCETTGTVFVDYWCVRPDAHGQKKVTPAGTCEHFAPKADECACADGRKGGCFLTSACVKFKGLPDDCAELTAFRAFRDGWLRQRPDGPERIAEYYAVAPSIVAGVEYCDDAPARYAEIRSRWLGPCYAALQRGEMERCYDTYRDMVQTLQKRYGVQ